MHDFDLAESYFDKAKLAGANRRIVAIGLTNTYLAEGNTRKAEVTLASLGPVSDFSDDYDYIVGRGGNCLASARTLCTLFRRSRRRAP